MLEETQELQGSGWSWLLGPCFLWGSSLSECAKLKYDRTRRLEGVERGAIAEFVDAEFFFF